MNPLLRATIAALLTMAAAVATAGAQDGALHVYPSRFTLDSARDTQPLVVMFTDAAGNTTEVTAAARFVPRRDGVLEIGDAAVARPLAEGETEFEVHWEGRCVLGRGRVTDAGREPPVSFRNDVIPALTRAGCNAGACHGAKEGKNGFALSLFGYDPDRDHRALTRELQARRVDCASPDQSLLLTKPLNEVTHKGGQRIEEDDAVHTILRGWITEGARDDAADASALVGIEVAPREFVLAGDGAEARVLVTARYADGTSRDVTRLALLSSSSEATVAIDASGGIRAGQRGEAHVLARYGPFAEVAQVIVLPDAGPPPEIEVAPVNAVDEFVFAKLRKLRLTPAPRCDDRTFVRRVHLDLVGALPEPEVVERFVADESPDKRAKLVDELLQRPEFSALFAAQWEEVLRIESDRLRRKGVRLWTRWLREAIRDGRPFDAVVRDMLTATGSTFEVPPANYYKVSGDPKVLAENAAQTFLGIRVQCAQCHDHPFERWRMDDYYGFAAFFGQVGRKTGEHPEETVVYPRGSGEVRNARDNTVSKPRFLGGEAPEIPRGADRREVLAEWLTARDNPFFAENVANRIWARLFGRGLVEPVDDVRVSNPPSHPKLHAWLGERLAASGFDVRALFREICLSHTYQAAQHPDALPAETYAGRVPRRLPAELLLDAVDDVTGVPTDLRGLPPGAAAVEAVGGDANSRFLELFGRPRRESACACERRNEPTLNQVLHLINGATIERKLRARDGWLERALAADTPPADMLDELFLRAYARPPGTDEREHLLAARSEVADEAAARRAFWADLLWAVLNSKEFLFQH